jgi:DNA modification methylase
MRRSTVAGYGLKPKDLCLIPFRVAIAAQEDGWWVRSAIIWSKPNPMPESTKDRPTGSHEYILMLTKSANYYWDADAVREQYAPASIERANYPINIMGGDLETGRMKVASRGERVDCPQPNPAGRNIRSVWEFPTETSGLEMCLKCKTVYESAIYQRLPSKIAEKDKQVDKEARDRPLESSIHPYRGDGWGEQAIEGRDAESKVKVCRCGASDWLSHFATFPEKLPEICIKAATPEVGCCSKCGMPYQRITEPTKEYAQLLGKDWNVQERKGHHHKYDAPSVTAQYKTIGWQPTCKCNAGKVPSIVLDPMAGSGRVGKVAKELGRKAILIDTSEDYCRLAKRRIEVVPLPMIFSAGEPSRPGVPDWF